MRISDWSSDVCSSDLLSQREAAFPREALFKSALDFGLPTTIGAIEQRVSSLVRSGELVPGSGEHKGWLTSRDALASEHRILAAVEAGRDAVAPLLGSNEADRKSTRLNSSH